MLDEDKLPKTGVGATVDVFAAETFPNSKLPVAEVVATPNVGFFDSSVDPPVAVNAPNGGVVFDSVVVLPKANVLVGLVGSIDVTVDEELGVGFGLGG